MLDNEPNGSVEPTEINSTSAIAPDSTSDSAEIAPKKAAKATKATRARKTTKAKAAEDDTTPAAAAESAPSAAAAESAEPAGSDAEAKPARRRRTAAVFEAPPAPEPVVRDEPAEEAPAEGGRRRRAPVAAIFVAPAPVTAPAVAKAAPKPVAEDAAADADDEVTPTRSRRRSRRGASADAEAQSTDETASAESSADEDEDEDDSDEGSARHRRRRGRRGRGRGKGPLDHDSDDEDESVAASSGDDDEEDDDEGSSGEGMTRRRRRRRRRGTGAGSDDVESEDGVVTVVKIREPRPARDEVQGVSGSTRLEAKRQRRRDGRDQRRTRPSILSESEFLARREAVDRVMAIRQKGDRTQIAVLEDDVLVEHYVARASSGSMVGNVYLGKVQNVLPSMEAAFVDIGRGRNAVLYAGEVNWDMAGLEGRARSIEQALKSGDSVLVQVTKDPIGHKGARLTSHVALSGRHLVYVPNGNASGISRKLPDTERKRLRDILKKLVPEGAGVIVRTAAEGASEDELERDVKRLSAQWSDIESKVASGGAPVQLYEEPDLVIRVVRDLFNEDFRELVVQGNDAFETVETYLGHVSPDLVARLRRHTGTSDIFTAHRIDEQILKGLDRKVFLPSGGSLVIDRTEAMTVIDVNTGKYTGTGGNLEETVTRNNLEAAEEIVRQLRLRDLGGIVVIDFIDMVLESNRELVLRRLTECLGRDRTKHQVTEITSLGLVQMTRKRIGQGLLEAFSETCEHCKGRGLIMHLEPVPDKRHTPLGHVEEPEPASAPTGRKRGRRGRGGSGASAEAEADSATDLDTDDIDEPVDAIGAVDTDDVLDEESEDAEDSEDSEADEFEPIDADDEPVVAAASVAAPAWQPKASSWVNLGAGPPIGGTVEAAETPADTEMPVVPDAAADSGARYAEEPAAPPAAAAPDDSSSTPPMHLQEPVAELAHLEGGGGDTTGRRKRGSLWRLRP